MILVIKKRHYGVTMWEYQEGNIEYYGTVLNTVQMESLHTNHNTVISESLYKLLGEKKLLDEVYELTGIKCFIKIYDHKGDHEALGKSYILERKPFYVLDTFSERDSYILFNHEDELLRIDKMRGLTDVVKELKANGYTPLQIDDWGDNKRRGVKANE